MIILTWITCCQKLYSYKVAKQNDDCFPGLSRWYICQVDILQQLYKSVTETVPLFYCCSTSNHIFNCFKAQQLLLVVFGVLQTIFPNQVDFQQQKSAPTKDVTDANFSFSIQLSPPKKPWNKLSSSFVGFQKRNQKFGLSQNSVFPILLLCRFFKKGTPKLVKLVLLFCCCPKPH